MTLQMGLTLSAILFVGMHFLLSHPLRAPLVRAAGEQGFRAIYSVIALLTFGAMIYFYHRIGDEPPLWLAGDALWIAASLLMWLGSVLFVGSFVRNPAFPGAPGPKGGPTGVFRITRHPMMWGFAIWAGVHLAVVAIPKALVFDGAILLLALAGAAMQDRKKAAAMGDTWHEWTAQTAFVPFTRGAGNPGMVALVGGTLLFFLATWAHPIPAGFWRWIG
ncbi:MAG TPA: NnrU family protein [Sphingomicrobium sp.]|nr:NnrU family protein [Sphingomicrobium sp.]